MQKGFSTVMSNVNKLLVERLQREEDQREGNTVSHGEGILET